MDIVKKDVNFDIKVGTKVIATKESAFENEYAVGVTGYITCIGSYIVVEFEKDIHGHTGCDKENKLFPNLHSNCWAYSKRDFKKLFSLYPEYYVDLI